MHELHEHLLIGSLTSMWGPLSLCVQMYFTLTTQDHSQRYAGAASGKPTTEDGYDIIRSEIRVWYRRKQSKHSIGGLTEGFGQFGELQQRTTV